MNIEIISVNVGRPRPIGVFEGETVTSGIVKSPVRSATVLVGALNIDGDGQADLRAHGGKDKALYAYASDHWPWWKSELGLVAKAATFGENLTLRGADERTISIGDRFRWGNVLLEVSEPRAPCYKLAMHTERSDVPPAMTLSARTGFYLRVLEEGNAPLPSTLIRVHASNGPSVRDAFVAGVHREVAREARQKVLDAPALATKWRATVAKRISG
jgi:MOSC domain-containing protein YiiM